MPCNMMPVYSSDYLRDDVRRAEKRAERMEAMLCGLCSVLDADGALGVALSRFDSKEAGIGVDNLRAWWQEHKAADEKRRKLEAEEAERKRHATPFKNVWKA